MHNFPGLRRLSEVLFEKFPKSHPYASAAEQVTQKRRPELDDQFGDLQQARPPRRESAAFPRVRVCRGLCIHLSLVGHTRQAVALRARGLRQLLLDISDKRTHVDARRRDAKGGLDLTLRKFNANCRGSGNLRGYAKSRRGARVFRCTSPEN